MVITNLGLFKDFKTLYREMRATGAYVVYIESFEILDGQAGGELHDWFSRTDIKNLITC